MASGNRMLLPRRQKPLSEGGGLEDHLQIRVHVPAGRSSMVLFTKRAGTNPNFNGYRLKRARCSFTGSTWRQFVRGVGPWKVCSRRYPALSARSHRPWLKAESWAAALKYRHSRRSRTTLGTIKRTITARDILAVCGDVENQSRRTGAD